MFSLEDLMLKYYEEYKFHIDFAHKLKPFDEDNYDYHVDESFHNKFENDIEVIKFIDEYCLDSVFLDTRYESLFLDYENEYVGFAIDNIHKEIYICILSYFLGGVA